jgi:putative transposase
MLAAAGASVTVTRAYKTELDLNDRQTAACKRHAGAARTADTGGLARKREAYEATGTSPTALALHRERNARKQTAVPWMYAVSKCAPRKRRCAIWRAPSPTSSGAAS